jgi:hypothetical protein
MCATGKKQKKFPISFNQKVSHPHFTMPGFLPFYEPNGKMIGKGTR